MHGFVNVYHYHYLRTLSPDKAREFVLKKLAEYDGNISKTARALKYILVIPLEGKRQDLLRTCLVPPKAVENETPNWIEDMIIN